VRAALFSAFLSLCRNEVKHSERTRGKRGEEWLRDEVRADREVGEPLFVTPPRFLREVLYLFSDKSVKSQLRRRRRLFCGSSFFVIKRSYSGPFLFSHFSCAPRGNCWGFYGGKRKRWERRAASREAIFPCGVQNPIHLKSSGRKKRPLAASRAKTSQAFNSFLH